MDLETFEFCVYKESVIDDTKLLTSFRSLPILEMDLETFKFCGYRETVIGDGKLRTSFRYNYHASALC